MKEAIVIKEVSESFTGRAILYKLIPPIQIEPDHKGDFKGKVSYVVVSTTHALFSGVETCIFPATKIGKVRDWGELEGSRRGTSSHAEVLEYAGYKIKDTKLSSTKIATLDTSQVP